MSLKDFQVISKLGEGAYSSVYKVQRVADGIEYALKKVKLMNLSDKEKINALNEVRILASIRHPNIVGYKEAFIDENSNSLCIIMEFANNGDLFLRIVENQKKGVLFNENDIWNFFIQIVKGLKALHDLKILHRDLKSANVFLNKEGTVKLGDMNVSKVAKKGLLYTQTGTPYYASPEVWKDQPYDNKSDIWSLGCVLYELATLKPPFRAEDMEGLYKKVIRGYYPRIPGNFSQDLSNVIRALLQVNPSLRPSCDKILQLPAVAKRLDERYLMEVDEGVPFLLNTIRVPKNIHYLTDRLPKPNYTPLKTRKVEKQKFLQTLAGYPEAEKMNRDDLTNSPINPREIGSLRLPQIGGGKQGEAAQVNGGGEKTKRRKEAQSVIPQREYQDYSQIDNINHHKYGSESDVSMLIAEANKYKENKRPIEMPKYDLQHNPVNEKYSNINIYEIYGVKPKKKDEGTAKKSKKAPHNLLDIEGESKPLVRKIRPYAGSNSPNRLDRTEESIEEVDASNKLPLINPKGKNGKSVGNESIISRHKLAPIGKNEASEPSVLHIKEITKTYKMDVKPLKKSMPKKEKYKEISSLKISSIPTAQKDHRYDIEI